MFVFISLFSIFTPNFIFCVMMNHEHYIKLLEDIRWNGIVVSPFNPLSKVYRCGDRYKCSASNRYFTARTQTIFQNSRIGLDVWFTAIGLVYNNPSLAPKELAEQIGISQKTAYAMMRKINLFFGASIKLAQPTDVSASADKMKLADWLKTIKKT
jgi:hypothetical protein